MAKLRFMISGGGTGGHIFPAIAIADALKKKHPEAEFLFVGAKGRMEMERVPKAGYKIEGLWISGIQRKLTLSNLSFPFKLLSSIAKSRRLIRKFKPDIAIGTGGFASGPLLYVAAGKGIPTLIQEQNSFPGITNKLLSKRVDKVCTAYENMDRYFPSSKILLTGNPIRNNIQPDPGKKTQYLESLGLNPNRKTLLILGGSLGARRINEIIGQNIEKLHELGLNVLWQTGKLYFSEITQRFGSQKGPELQILDFIKDMGAAYGVADFVISRAGAGTISELAVVKKAAMLIPSPNVAEDHQTKNAMALSSKSAAILFREKQSNEEFIENIGELMDRKSELEQNISDMALPDAADQIATVALKLIEP